MNYLVPNTPKKSYKIEQKEYFMSLAFSALKKRPRNLTNLNRKNILSLTFTTLENL
jgi:hypothetical protein